MATKKKDAPSMDTLEDVAADLEVFEKGKRKVTKDGKTFEMFVLGDNVFDQAKEDDGVWCPVDESRYGPDGPSLKVRRAGCDKSMDVNKRMEEFLVDRFGANYQLDDIPEKVQNYVTARRTQALVSDWKHIKFTGDEEDRPVSEEHLWSALVNADRTLLAFIMQQALNQENFRKEEIEGMEKN